MGLDFFAPLIDFSLSTLKGQEQIATITTLLANKENVVLFANHQTEADPYAIQLLMQPPFTMAYVAGERVVTDALAVPFSLGTNLFCVYSKKYFDVYPDRKASMMEHNKLTMLRLGEHLDQGGQCITIFPSGGRDRPNADKIIEVAKFDPQSIELLYLLGRKAKRPTHYFPMALLTHDILPPPETLQIDLGEKRPTKEAPIHIHVGQEISMDNLCDPVTLNKHQQREERAHRIWQMVYSMYHQF